jgi:hypothetical protein
MRLVLLSAIFLTIASCNGNNNTIPYKELIKGDWVNNQIHEGESTKGYFLNFEDSVCSLFFSPDYFDYTINDDSLIVSKDQLKFKILLLTKDSLILSSSLHDQFVTDTLFLSKPRHKNSLIPSKIYFVSSGGGSVFPGMQMEIDSSGKILFRGRLMTQEVSGQKGQLDKKTYGQIVNSFQNLPLDSLQRHYEAQHSDDRSIGVMIVANGKKIITSSYGYTTEPPELRLFYDRLVKLRQRVSFQPDSSITEVYFYLATGKENILQVPDPPMIEFSSKKQKH